MSKKDREVMAEIKREIWNATRDLLRVHSDLLKCQKSTHDTLLAATEAIRYKLEDIKPTQKETPNEPI